MEVSDLTNDFLYENIGATRRGTANLYTKDDRWEKEKERRHEEKERRRKEENERRHQEWMLMFNMINDENGKWESFYEENKLDIIEIDKICKQNTENIQKCYKINQENENIIPEDENEVIKENKTENINEKLVNKEIELKNEEDEIMELYEEYELNKEEIEIIENEIELKD
ncbi:hypothetical protein FQR65_LT00624 [Abscondita terminalis]|nr:hypothetical protein FQR65_LT00624 [Abscondita terminalis]